jgi:hypothetical protein
MGVTVTHKIQRPFICYKTRLNLWKLMQIRGGNNSFSVLSFMKTNYALLGGNNEKKFFDRNYGISSRIFYGGYHCISRCRIWGSISAAS